MALDIVARSSFKPLSFLRNLALTWTDCNQRNFPLSKLYQQVPYLPKLDEASRASGLLESFFVAGDSLECQILYTRNYYDEAHRFAILACLQLAGDV